jgi:hypothetical protein
MAWGWKQVLNFGRGELKFWIEGYLPLHLRAHLVSKTLLLAP